MKTYTQKEIVSMVLGALVLVVIGIFIFTREKKEDTLPPVSTIVDDTTKEEVKVNPKSEVGGTVKPVSLSYAKALEVYANKRIQLGASELCTATPALNTYKDGTSIMLDNRSALDRTIKIGGVGYFIKAYDFSIVKLSSSTLPVTYLVDCNKQQNVATILLQK